MKIIDQTPFFNNETGQISMLDRGRAMMKNGTTWITETMAQREVMSVLGKVLDRNYNLLRNVSPPGLDASFPFILVGPPGVFVMYVTPLTGMFRAKGDQWGTISGSTFKNEKPNLLTRTERMARAVQVFLQRQGYSAITSVDAVLLCSDPSFNVDSIRPIIRVVLRDALERFAISLMQARVVLNPQAVEDITDRLLNPPQPAPPQPAETLTPTPTQVPVSDQVENPYAPAPGFPESLAPAWANESTPLPDNSGPVTPSQVPPRQGMNKKQWVVLIVIFVFWCLLISVFLFLVVKDQWSYILSLLP